MHNFLSYFFNHQQAAEADVISDNGLHTTLRQWLPYCSADKKTPLLSADMNTLFDAATLVLTQARQDQTLFISRQGINESTSAVYTWPDPLLCIGQKAIID